MFLSDANSEAPRSKVKGPPCGGPRGGNRSKILQSGLDLEAPCFQQGLRDIFRILIAAGPFTQPGGANVLVRREFELSNHLFEFGDRGSYRADRLGLAPIRISASLRHDKCSSCL